MRLGSPDTVAGPRAWPGAARRRRVRLAYAPGCHFPFTRLRGHPPAFRYSGVTDYILAQPAILAKTAIAQASGTPSKQRQRCSPRAARLNVASTLSFSPHPLFTAL
jgi:hypothetical protein